MGRQLLPPDTGRDHTGRWVGIAMGRRRSFPIRIIAIGDFAGANITIEELVAGVPSDESLYGNENMPIGQEHDTGYPKVIGTIAPGGPDLTVEFPTSEWIRAKTGAFSSGRVDVCVVETLE